MKRGSVLIVIVFFLIGCSNPTVKEVLQEESEKKTFLLKATNHTVAITPVSGLAYLAQVAALADTVVLSNSLIDSLKLVYKVPSHLFKMKLSPLTNHDSSIVSDVLYGQLDNKSYKDRFQYFNSEMKQKIWVESTTNKVKTQFFHFERSWGLSKSRNFFFGFSTDVTNLQTLVLDDIVLGLGRQKIQLQNLR